MVEFPVGAHVLTSPLRNPDVAPVAEATFGFAEEILNLEPALDNSKLSKY
jgi:hypothetical protein